MKEYIAPNGKVYATKESYLEDTITELRSQLQEKQTYIDALKNVLIKCRKVFDQLNGDTITSLNYMNRLSTEINNIIGDVKHD
tara:strand:+ start:2631 stop:2879 length:249 start_codon:yes stop_codon:yes gene_type:complete